MMSGWILKDEYRFEDLIYSPHYGVFYWVEKHEQIKPHYKKVPWCNAGSHDSNGYLQIYSNGKTYQAHRLAWFLVTGEWPDNQIDHINRDITDNRFDNFRVVTNRVNARNRKDNTEFPGVRFCKNRKTKPWQARIKIDYKENNLGYFETKEEAIEAYTQRFEEVHKIESVGEDGTAM